MNSAQLDQILDAEEPDYSKGRNLKPEDVAYLEVVTMGNDHERTARALCLISMSSDPRSTEILYKAARHNSDIVRLAVAGGCRNLPNTLARSEVLGLLINDPVFGVRKIAVNSFKQLA